MARTTLLFCSPLVRRARSALARTAQLLAFPRPAGPFAASMLCILVIALLATATLLSALVTIKLPVRRRTSSTPDFSPESASADGSALLLPAASEPYTLHVPQVEGFPCEEAYGEHVRFHVVIPLPTREHFQRVLKHLGALGTTGADVFGYVRTQPSDCCQARVQLPCGMRFHERLLLPNLGEEGAVIMTHIASVYADLPDSVMLLHGAFPSWHSLCSVLIRRARAVYRGLGEGPAATPAMRAFARQAITLNACKAGYNLNNCCGPLLCGPREAVDEPSCPWERVGTAPGSVKVDGDWPVALCQLRDRSPDTNWTVLASDVPEFFMRQREILAAYETDPEQRVPITHQRSMPSPAPAADHTPRRLQAAAERPPASGLVPNIEQSPKQEGEEGYAAGPTRPQTERLQNVRDLIFPWSKFTDELKHAPSLNYPQYGLEKFWRWMLKFHDLPVEEPPLRPGETPRRWCCLQFIAPRHVFQRAPVGWWEDVAWFMTHTAWKPTQEWPAVLGQLTEYSFWRALGLHSDALDEVRLYVDVEREMGVDEQAGTCAGI